MDEGGQGLSWIGFTHEAFADEETTEANLAKSLDDFGIRDARFGDEYRTLSAKM